MYFDLCINFLEDIKVNEFYKDYENLKNQIDGDKGKLIGFLFVGLLLGRIYEKLQNTKKKIFKKFK
jgi:hypothetical protein